MSRITDYAFLFQKSFGTSGVNAIGSFQLSQLNSSSVQSQLKAAGINTNSKQYKAAVKKMMSAGNGAMYGNIQGIKNLMSHYDKDGDYINPVNGLAGLLVTDDNENSRRRIISIPDSSKEEMYELTKKEFLRENGVHNGDTTKHPLYQWLTHKSENGVTEAKIVWNFHKFLIDENGRWVASIGSTTSPLSQEIVEWIEE